MSSSSSSSQRPPESRFPCHYDDREARSCIPPAADWVNNSLPPSSSVMTRSRTGGESHFDFFYHAIFTFVHSALTILLAPVLKKNTTRRPKRSSSPSRTQRAPAMTPQSYREVDPELAMPPQMNYDRSSSNNNNSSSILKSHQRRDSYQQQQQQAAQSSAAAAKSVRFPEQKRSRPPLGRISSSIGSTATTASSSTSASVSSSESSRSSSSLSSSSSSSDGRVRISPWRVSPSPRTHHSTYFLSD
jgi:hypothetical protein